MEFVRGKSPDLLRFDQKVDAVFDGLGEHLLVVMGVLKEGHKPDDVAVFHLNAGQHAVEERVERLKRGFLVLLVENVKELVFVGLNQVELLE